MQPEQGASAARDASKDLAAEEVAPGLFRLPLPIPFEVGPVNCYLLRRDEPLLVDAGPRTDEAWAALLAHFRAVGFDPADLRHVVVTHAHVDHYGNVARLAAAAPRARIWAHEAEARAIFEHDDHMRARAEEVRGLVRFWGWPEETHDAAVRGYMGFRKFAESLGRERWAPLRGDEDEVAAGATRLRAIHCPGHTEGLVCLVLEAGGAGGECLLFASDHILERITPNPTIYMPPYRGRRSGLGDYVESLRRVRDVPAARVLPGHGRPFAGLRERVDEILSHHERRKAKILSHLRDGTPLTVMGLVRRLWPRLPEPETWLACREVQGHLDLLLDEAPPTPGRASPVRPVPPTPGRASPVRPSPDPGGGDPDPGGGDPDPGGGAAVVESIDEAGAARYAGA